MVDATEAIGKARAAVAERADLPGMSLMEHLDELRKRIVHSAAYLAAGFVVCWVFHDRLVNFLQAPLDHINKSLVFTHPMDALNLDLQVAFLAGAIITAPLVLYRYGSSSPPAFTRKRSASPFRSWPQPLPFF